MSIELPLLEPDIQVDADLDRHWNVVLLDDDHHTFEYVIVMLHDIFGYTLEDGLALAVEVHLLKRVTVATCHREIAEMRQEQIHNYGADWRSETCAGSMSAILEPV